MMVMDKLGCNCQYWSSPTCLTTLELDINIINLETLDSIKISKYFNFNLNIMSTDCVKKIKHPF